MLVSVASIVRVEPDKLVDTFVPPAIVKVPDVVIAVEPLSPASPTDETVPVFVVNPESLLNPEILIFAFVNFF